VKERKPIQILRERRGGVPKDLLARNREQKRLLKRLTEALEAGPRTVPEVAAETGIDAGEVLWHLMALRKFGKLVEGEEREGYFEYALKEDEA
jgi:predicted Rossmann fold nucleotide-binding protein DprA/Smf involved in DNA uptake